MSFGTLPRQETAAVIKAGTFERKTGALNLKGDVRGRGKVRDESTLDKDTLVGAWLLATTEVTSVHEVVRRLPGLR